MRKTKVRVVGDPGLVEKISDVVQAHFVLCKPARKFDKPVGRDTSHSKAPGCTIYLDVKKEKLPVSMKCPDCGSQLTSMKFVDTWDADGNPEEVNEYLVCAQCQTAWESLDLKSMQPYKEKDASDAGWTPDLDQIFRVGAAHFCHDCGRTINADRDVYLFSRPMIFGKRYRCEKCGLRHEKFEKMEFREAWRKRKE